MFACRQLTADQLLALEQMRQDRGVVFVLDVHGNSLGPAGIRAFDEELKLTVSLSDWIGVLKQARAADILLVGVNLSEQADHSPVATPAALVRQAHVFLQRGEYGHCVAECRRALESLWKLGQLAEPASKARRSLATKDERESMNKHDRVLAVGEAIKNFTQPAHHVGNDGDPEMFSRTDAALALATVAALVSTLAPMIGQSQ